MYFCAFLLLENGPFRARTCWVADTIQTCRVCPADKSISWFYILRYAVKFTCGEENYESL
jgi:hypothetical protein